MLILKILYFYLIYTNVVCNGDDELVILKNDSQMYCITNNSGALSWIEPLSENNIKNAGTQFLNVPSSSNCNFENYNQCSDKWTQGQWSIKNSLENKILYKPFLDKRWENFPLFQTKPDKSKGFITNPLYVLKFNGIDFEVPISIRTSQAHLFLCDGKSIFSSNCYWFLLQGWSNTLSAVRKCSSKSIMKNKFPEGPCQDRKSEIFHNNTSWNYMPLFLDTNKWNHFKIMKHDDRISFSFLNNTPILSYTDHEPFSVSHLILASSGENGLWKIHEFNYLYTQVPHSVTFEEEFEMEKTLCLSMFIIMCPACSMSIRFENTNFEKTYYGRETIEWKDIFLCPKIHQSVKLEIITIGNIDNQFWAIDDIQLSNENRFRILSKTPNDGTQLCQLITEKQTILSSEPEPQLIDPECSFEKSKIVCMDFRERNLFSSSGIKICEKRDNQDICYCSSGYEGSNCQQNCPYLKWGYLCSKRCGKCEYYANCNPIDGKCTNGCTTGFKGNYCDIPNGAIFLQPPELINKSYSQCTIRMHNFTISNQNENYKYFQVRYQEYDTNNYYWNQIEEWFEFGRKQEISVNQLRSGITYKIDAIIYNKNSRVTYDGEYVRYVLCSTSCYSPQEQDFSIEPNETTAHLIVNNQEYLCDNSYTAIFGSVLLTDTFILDLKPSTNYTLKIYIGNKYFFKSFRTLESAPGKVLLLKTSIINSTSVRLEWREPPIKNGIIRYYFIKYQKLGSTACSQEQKLGEVFTINTTDKVYEIGNLTPFSKYQICVSAFTVREGEPYIENLQTDPSNDITMEEVPNIDFNETMQTLLLSKIDCDLIKGSFSIEWIAQCKDSWCSSDNNIGQTKLHQVLPESIPLEPLMPFTKYLIRVLFCRGPKVTCTNEKTLDIQTKHAAPPKVNDLSVYSKGYDFISIRWRPPFPPNGMLEQFKIEYFLVNGGPFNILNTEPENSKCTLWENYYCFNITSSIEKDQNYRITVSSKNRNVNEYGEISYFYVQTKVEEPLPPYDLKSEWTYSNLSLNWKHPNKTNGILTSFKLIISPKTRREEISSETFNVENNYNINYTFPVNVKNLNPCTYYNFIIFSQNTGYESKTNTRIRDITPPSIPEISHEETNTSITLKISEFDKNCLQMKPNISVYIRENEIQNLDNLNNGPLHPYYSEQETKFILGNGTEDNPSLKPETNYTIYIIISISPSNVVRKNITILKISTRNGINNHDTPLLLIIALVLGSFLVTAIISIAIIKRKEIKTELMVIRLRVLNNIITNPRNSHGTEPQKQEEHVPLTEKLENKKIIPINPKHANNKLPNPKANTENNLYSQKVKITEFEQYVKDSINNDVLNKQHALFPRGQTKPWDYGALKLNKSKNRYNNLIAYDHSRVVLEKIPNDEYSDYINASYIDGYKIPRAYIATQGPKVATVYDFWRMVWQENVENIIMLANVYENGKKKVEKYWPDINESLEFKEFIIQYISNSIFADYEYTVLKVTRNNEQRNINHLHFTSWPDHGVPLYSQSLVPFLQKMLKIPLSAKSPVIVHCSAGVGRTGTIILCDICLRMAAREGAIDILNILQSIRSQRANMVDNVEQYKLAHLVILECLMGLNTAIECNELDDVVQRLLAGDTIRVQMRYLREKSWQDQVMKTVAGGGQALSIQNEKNRIAEIVPEFQGRVFLTPFPPDDDSSSYINAVKVDGFRSPGRYIVTQQPLPNTLGDFWRLVEQSGVSVIISLNDINMDDESSCQFWPTREQNSMTPINYITLEHLDTRVLECYDIIRLNVLLKNKIQRTVEVVAFKGWKSNQLIPEKIEQFLTFWEESDALCRGSEEIIVTCYDGATACGLYVAMSFIIEKMKLEQICDVCQAVRNVRHNRNQFVSKKEQFIFLYNAAVHYINGFQSYANFN